ncbi:MAG: hypothetical protein MJE68_04785 [Proteobacteria bacterium]|nr:hypothetical protein [Pseudomonadota bacterium]
MGVDTEFYVATETTRPRGEGIDIGLVGVFWLWVQADISTVGPAKLVNLIARVASFASPFNPNFVAGCAVIALSGGVSIRVSANMEKEASRAFVPPLPI